jgi:hypothetical protein
MTESPDPTLQSTVPLQRTQSYFGVLKAANTIGYLATLYLTWLFISDHSDWRISTGCAIVSGCWLVLTRIKINHLLQTYFDVLSRIETNFPITLGTVMSAIAVSAPGIPFVHYCGAAEILAWLYIFARYLANKSHFEKQGHGPLPKGTWVNPPANIMRPGDLILTSGNIAKELHESVGHAETVLRMPDGSMKLFSSYMDRGAFLHDLDVLTIRHEHGDYILLHLSEPWNAEQQDSAAQIAEEMISSNKQWAAQENQNHKAIIDKLPLSLQHKEALEKRFHVSGYDWFGTFMGRIAPNRWTCISACLELYHRMGVKTGSYGTGLLGFGTTIFDPIMPVRFLSDPAFQLVTQSNLANSQVPLEGTAFKT